MVLLGPGSTVSHDALRLMARHGTALVAVGEDGVRCYTAPPLMPDTSDIARRQMRAWGDPDGSRITIARRMYALRLGEVCRTRASTRCGDRRRAHEAHLPDHRPAIRDHLAGPPVRPGQSAVGGHPEPGHYEHELQSELLNPRHRGEVAFGLPGNERYHSKDNVRERVSNYTFLAHPVPQGDGVSPLRTSTVCACSTSRIRPARFARRRLPNSTLLPSTCAWESPNPEGSRCLHMGRSIEWREDSLRSWVRGCPGM